MAQFKSDTSIRRIVQNSAYTAMRFAVFTISGILFIPFLVKQYGSSIYGLIALAGFLTQYIGFIFGCVGSSTARFLNVALNRDDWKQAGEIFSTSIVANLIVVALQLPLYAFGIWKLEWLIDFPPEVSLDFRILVICNVLTFLVAVLASPYRTPIAASNRLDIGAKVEVFLQLLRLVLLFVLILQIGPKLWIIGVVDLALSLISAVVTYKVSRYLARDLVFQWRLVSRKWIRPVVGMAGWTLVAEIGQLLFMRTDVWIVNKFIDIELAGVCAALLVWPNFAQQLAKTISSVITPVITIDYANNRFGRIRDTVLFFTEFMNLMSLVICGVIIIWGEPLLNLWMGETYRRYHVFLILMLIHFPITLAREAMWPVFPAFNKMRPLGISNIVSGLFNIAFSIAAALMGYGLFGVIVVTGISLILQRTVFLSLFTARLLGFKYRYYLLLYLPGIILYILYMFHALGGTGINTTFMGSLSLLLALVMGLHMIRSSSVLKAVFQRTGSRGNGE